MRDRWMDILLAGLFAFLAVGCISAAATALLGEADPRFVPAAIATAAVFTAFAVWTIDEIEG